MGKRERCSYSPWASVAVNNPPWTAMQVRPPVNKPVAKIANKFISEKIVAWLI